MRFQHVYHAVHCEPWLILPSAHATIVALLESRLNGNLADPKAGTFGDIIESMAAQRPKMTIANGIAEIPINGTIGKGLGKIEKACGGVSVEDVMHNLAEALGHRDVNGILLNIDSPGGTTTGVPEMAAAIERASWEKPVVAFTDSLMASAAYWAGSQADLIVASKSANIGSIGVFIPWTDRTKMAEMLGLKVEAIKNKEGTYKAMGLPGTALTDAQREHLQGAADEIFSMFKGDILSRRPNVSGDAMRGQTLLASPAKSQGLIDDIGDMARARASLQALIKMRG